MRAVHRAWQKAYVGRHVRPRELRLDWIMKINAATRQFGMRYSQFVRFLPAAGVDLNRKVLADLAATEPYSFRALVEVAARQRDAEVGKGKLGGGRIEYAARRAAGLAGEPADPWAAAGAAGKGQELR